MRTIKTWRDPYGEGFSTTRRKEIVFEPGVTVLVGCNGIGKSTLLNNIKSCLKKDNIPYYFYNNLTDGGHNSFEEMAYKENYGAVANMLCSSEGENITNNLGIMMAKLRKFIVSGDDGRLSSAFDRVFNHDEEKITTTERWILLDAIDSGYSIDNVVELKDVFDLILEDANEMGYEVYIVVSCNEYELASNMKCLDISEGTYIEFGGYDSFKNFILKNRKKKNKRYAALQ